MRHQPFEPNPLSLGIRAVFIAATMPVSRAPAPSPAPSPEKPKPSPPWAAMGAEEILRHLDGPGYTDDPLVRRLAELLELQFAIREDDAALAEECRAEVERKLGAALERIEALEDVLLGEDVPIEKWQG